MLKIRAWDNSKEVIIAVDDITGSIKKGRKIVEIDQALRDNPIITLDDYPLSFSELVVLNGMVMTEGSNYDYTINLNVVTFNVGILPKKGHILINYNYK